MLTIPTFQRERETAFQTAARSGRSGVAVALAFAAIPVDATEADRARWLVRRCLYRLAGLAPSRSEEIAGSRAGRAVRLGLPVALPKNGSPDPFFALVPEGAD